MIAALIIALTVLAPGMVAAQEAELGVLAHDARRAFASHDFRLLFDDRLMIRLELPGQQGASSVRGALAATTLADFVRRAEEIDVAPVGAAVVDVGQGYIELRRSFHLVGIQHLQIHRVLLSARSLGGRWRIVEVWVLEGPSQ